LDKLIRVPISHRKQSSCFASGQAIVHPTYESSLMMAVTVEETVGDNPGAACIWRKK
jgi:acyl dehydratase